MGIEQQPAVLAFALAMVWPLASEAALVAYDPFKSGANRANGEYTASSDMRTMGAAALGWVGTSGIDGFGVAHAGTTGNFVANATGESSAVVDYEQGGRMNWVGVGNFAANRNITRQLNPTPTSSEWWFSIMTNRLGWANPGAGVDNTYAVGGFTNSSGVGLQVGYEDSSDDGTPNLTLRAGGQFITLEDNAPSSAARFVLVKLTINQSGNDALSIWANPTTLTAATPATIEVGNINVSDSLTPFTQSKYESPGQSGPVFWDEIRLGTDFASVTGIPVPEPAAIAFLGVGGLLAVVRRSRV